MDIDFVVLWIDNTDLKWQSEKEFWEEKYNKTNWGNGAVRFRDWGLFKYWFRCIEKNAPWVRKVHLVTNGQVPSWLDLSNPKLELNIHSSFMDPESLPTFSSHAIELQLGNINTLAEHFVYYNDDTFLLKEVSPDYFFKNGKRCDCFCEKKIWLFSGTGFPRILQNDIDAINSVVNGKRKLVRNEIGLHKWLSAELPLSYRIFNLTNYIRANKFLGISVEHIANAYTKTQFAEVWDVFRPRLEATIRHKFRSDEDVNQYLIRYWSIINNDFEFNRYTKGQYLTLRDLKTVCKSINGDTKYPVACINDDDTIPYDENKVQIIRDAFEKAYPNKSSFEL